MGRRALTTLVVTMTILTAGCDLEQFSSPTSSSELVDAFLGDWTSANLETAVDACTAFDWQAVPQGDGLSGPFTATCGGIELTGTGSGLLVGDTLEFTASGQAVTPQGLTCPFQLTGTARREGGTVRIEYVGSTCTGALGGTEILVAR